MSTRNIDGIRPAAVAAKTVADSVRTEHARLQNEQKRINDQLASDLENLAIARRAVIQESMDEAGAVAHDLGQTTFMIGQPPVEPRAHHPLNICHWNPLQWILAITLALLGLLLAWSTFGVVSDIFGNPVDGWRTVLKIVWAGGWVILGFGLGGLIGFGLTNPNQRR